MGYIRHHAILVTSYNHDAAHMAHEQARTIFGPLVSEVKRSIINIFFSFAIFPDGSNEGWDDSEQGDTNRTLFKYWLNEQCFEDKSSPYAWVEVQYGDDNRETRIVDDSDAIRRERNREGSIQPVALLEERKETQEND
jgi:hypothetical protein